MEFDGCKIPHGPNAPTNMTASINESSITSEEPVNYGDEMQFCFSTGTQIIEFYGFDEVRRLLLCAQN